MKPAKTSHIFSGDHTRHWKQEHGCRRSQHKNKGLSMDSIVMDSDLLLRDIYYPGSRISLLTSRFRSCSAASLAAASASAAAFAFCAFNALICSFVCRLKCQKRENDANGTCIGTRLYPLAISCHAWWVNRDEQSRPVIRKVEADQSWRSTLCLGSLEQGRTVRHTKGVVRCRSTKLQFMLEGGFGLYRGSDI